MKPLNRCSTALLKAKLNWECGAVAHRDIIVIGGSTGSLDVLHQLLADLPPDLPAAVFLVVHVGDIGRNLTASALERQSRLPIATAVDGERIKHGRIYVAPSGHHLLVMDDVVRLGRGPRENMARPALDPLFRSAAITYGTRVIAVVLSGMLNDGAAGIAAVRRCGGVTVVQDPADSVADEMPLGALQAAEVDYRAPAVGLGGMLTKLVGEAVGAAPPVPPDIVLEVQIAAGLTCDSAVIGKIARPSTLSCPACGGVLSELDEKQPLRFRCQVGHAYTAHALSTQQEASVDEALRVALRIVEQRAVLVEKMAKDAAQHGRKLSETTFEDRAREYREHADLLRRTVLEKGFG
jgi:two-component system, chemotaxis family, protein-glutamate methylesterase/glutaminase